ncbi:MAG: hypothetical protein AB1611_14355 [bacterium]
MPADKIAQIKLRIRKISESVRRLQEENLWLKGKITEYELIIKQKEVELQETQKKLQIISSLERENKQFHLDREALQKTIDQMIEELKGF